jgi:hypothetical protein
MSLKLADSVTEIEVTAVEGNIIYHRLASKLYGEGGSPLLNPDGSQKRVYVSDLLAYPFTQAELDAAGGAYEAVVAPFYEVNP